MHILTVVMPLKTRQILFKMFHCVSDEEYLLKSLGLIPRYKNKNIKHSTSSLKLL